MAEVKRTRKRKGRRTFGATRRLPSGRWQASYLGPDGVRRIATQTFPEAADANAWLVSVEASIAGGDWRPPELSRETFGAYGTLLAGSPSRPPAIDPGAIRDPVAQVARAGLRSRRHRVAEPRSVAGLVPRADRRPSGLNTAREGLQAGSRDAQHCSRGRPAPKQPVPREGRRDRACD